MSEPTGKKPAWQGLSGLVVGLLLAAPIVGCLRGYYG